MIFKKRILIYICFTVTIMVMLEAFMYSLDIIVEPEASGVAIGRLLSFCMFIEIVYRGWFDKPRITNAP